MVHSHPPPSNVEQDKVETETNQEPQETYPTERSLDHSTDFDHNQDNADTITPHNNSGRNTPEKDYSDDEDNASLNDLVAVNSVPEVQAPEQQVPSQNLGSVNVVSQDNVGCTVKQVPANAPGNVPGNPIPGNGLGNSTPGNGPVNNVVCDNSGCHLHQNPVSTSAAPAIYPATATQPAFPPAVASPPGAAPLAINQPTQPPAFYPVMAPQPVAPAVVRPVPPYNVAPAPPYRPVVPPAAGPPAVPQPDPIQAEPQKSKGFGYLFRKGKAKNAVQDKADPPQLAPSGVPPPVSTHDHGSQTLVYDPKSSVKGQAPPAPKPEKKAGKSKPVKSSKNVEKHTFHDQPPPGFFPTRPCGYYPPRAAYPPGGVPMPQEGDQPPAIPPRQVFHPPGSFQPPPGSRDGATTPLSMTSATSQVSTVGPVGFGVGYLDIIPNPSDTFADLMKHANNWLNGAHTFRAVSFESLNIPYDNQCNLNTEEPIYELGGDRQYGCILRMWVTPKKADENPAPQRVGYCCLFPKWQGVRRSDRPSMPSCENLDETLSRCNSDFSGSRPLKGKVISMETVSHLHAFHKDGTPIHLDPEACCWADSSKQDVNILSIVRIYYSEDPEATPEVIGVQDFVPECKEEKDMLTLETSNLLVDAAGEWVKKFPGLRVTNLQTMIKFGDDADEHLCTRKMMQRRRAGNVCFSRFLRMYYSKKVDNSPEGPVLETPATLFYKDFVPAVRPTSEGKVKRVEKSGELMQKLVAWYCLSGHEVVCVETVPIYSKEKLKFDPEENFSCVSGKAGADYQLFTFRIYTDTTSSSEDDPADGDSVQGSVRPSPTGSVTSHDFAAWPFASVPSGYTVQK